jgi:drug/metabolite transporter (DMT)-like permease
MTPRFATSGPILCALAISAGQVLFKLLGRAYASGTGLFAPRSLALLSLAGLLYVGATAAWIWLLRTLPLSRAYPYMAVSFLVVPLLSWLVLGERLPAAYLAGVALVAAGLFLVTAAQ